MTTTDQLLTRITALEQRVYELEVARLPETAAPATSQSPSATGAPTKISPPPPTDRTERVPTPPAPRRSPIADRLGVPRTAPASEVLLRWVGIGLVFLAAAFLVSTAVSRGWIGPELQLAGAVAIGVALIGWALRLAPHRDGWALAAGHGGIAVLATSVFLGRETLDLYGLGVAVAATAATAAVAFWLGMRIERASIASSGVFLAVAIPAVMAAADWYSALEIGAWLTVLIVVTAVVSWLRRWPSLRIVLFLVVATPLLSLAGDIADGSNQDIAVAVVVGLIAVAVFVLGPPIEAAAEAKVASDRRRVDLEPVTSAIDQRLYSILPTWTWGLFALLFFGERGGASWLAIAIAAVSALGIVALRSYLVPTMAAAGGVGASVLLSIGLAGVVDGPALLVALTVQAIGLTWLAVRFKDALLGINAAIVAVIAGLWGASGIVEAMYDGATLGEHLAHLLVVASIAAGAYLGREGSWWFAPAGLAAWVGWLGWLAGVFGELPQGQMAVSITWAICGAALFVLGLRRDMRDVANLGLITLGVTVVKLVTVDLDAVDTMWRAGLFFLVGIGLLRLGLLVSRPDDDDIDDGANTIDLAPSPGDVTEAGQLLSPHE